jgi:hypothetical protein
VWILSEILYLMMVDGESSGAFTPSAHEVCPVSRETFLEMDRSTTFYHIHPCATHHRLEFVRPRPRSRVRATRVPACASLSQSFTCPQACTGLARRQCIALPLIRIGRGQAQRVHCVGRQCCSFAACSGSIPQFRLRSKRVEVGRAAARAVEAFGCHPVL